MASRATATMRSFAAGILGVVLATGWLHPAYAQTSAGPKPVLVELFTSEGCSDCPPADDLLARLDHDQFIPGVHAIVLSEHVTYWNHDGWRDPFSLEQLDYRQKDYQERFRLDSAYTPQMVVDGAAQFVGNNANALAAAVEHAASAPKQDLAIAVANWEKDGVHFSVQASGSQGAHLFAALAEDATHSEVNRGENAGRTLRHVAVARTLKEFKSGFGATPLTLSASGVEKNAASLRLVVFLVDTHSGHVVAAAEQTLQKQ